MECDFKKKDISVCKTIFENFMEEKCECDVTVPDYYPAVEKIIHCKADALVTEKEISNDRLTVSGICRFSVLYMGEDGEEIRSLVDEARFSESYSLKDIGTQAWVQTVVRTSGVSCRVMNSKKINVRATVSVAIKVKSGKTFEVVDKPNCDHIETLYEECNTYTVYGQVEEHVKVQGGIQTHTDVHAILESSVNVCIKDIKVLPGKAVLKGILNLYVLLVV